MCYLHQRERERIKKSNGNYWLMAVAVVGDSILVFIFNQLRLRVWWNVNSNMCVICAKERRGRENQVNLTLLLIIKDRRKSNEMLSSTTFTSDIISLFFLLFHSVLRWKETSRGKFLGWVVELSSSYKITRENERKGWKLSEEMRTPQEDFFS